jgi:hypothetical protein
MMIARALLVFTLLFVIPPSQTSGDLKFETHWWTSWDKGSRIKYVKGDFIRVDDCLGQDCSHASEEYVSHCGVWSAMNLKGVFYESSDDSSYGVPAETTPKQKDEQTANGQIRVILESVDTGERKTMFGYTVKHILTTAKFDTSQSSCPANETAHRFDGWYLDQPFYTGKCSESDSAGLSELTFGQISDCGDKVIIERTGPTQRFGLTEREEYVLRGEKFRGEKFGGGYTVTAISHESLDDSLFAKPNTKPFSEFRSRFPKRAVSSGTGQPTSH